MEEGPHHLSCKTILFGEKGPVYQLPVSGQVQKSSSKILCPLLVELRFVPVTSHPLLGMHTRVYSGSPEPSLFCNNLVKS